MAPGTAIWLPGPLCFILPPMRLLVLAAVIALAAACSRPPTPPAQEAKPAGPGAPAAPREAPNVLLVTLDTLRADRVGCYGGKVPTPAIDRLAARGVRFETAIAQVPLTAPSHASILTGTYPQVHGVRDMGGFVLARDVPTLATVAAGAGYQTAAVVGAAVLNRHYGLDRGFALYSDDMKAPAGAKALSVVGEVRGEVVTQRAVEWLGKRDRAKPFLLWAHYYDPHFPYNAPEPYKSRYPKDSYGAEIAYTDEQVGKLVDALGAEGIADRTIVALLADHGESLGEHGEFTHGVFLYDSTVRIPLVVAGPRIPAGRVVRQQVRSIDVMPTIAELIGGEPGGKVQGASLVPAIVDGKGVRTNYCYLETLYPKTHLGWSELRAMRTDEWKLVVAPKPELYRIAADRAEASNVVARNPAEADQLQKKVWEVAGPPESLGELRPQPMNDERRRELAALGYVGAGSRPLRIDMSGPDPKDRVAVLELLERATDAMNHDRFAAAVPLLQQALRQDPTNPLVYKDLGHTFQRLGLFERAEAVYREAIRNKADGDETHAEIGEIHVRRGELNQAVESMERAARLNPANLENLINMATAYLHLGQTDQTERVLRALLAQNPRYAAAHNLYGILDLQRGRPLDARRHLEKAVEIEPELAEPYMNLGLLAQNAGETRTAIAYYRKFLRYAKPDRYREIIPKVRAALADLGASG